MSSGKFFSLKESIRMKTAIMGFGNPVRSDDGVGMYVIEELQKIIGDNDAVNILIWVLQLSRFFLVLKDITKS